MSKRIEENKNKVWVHPAVSISPVIPGMLRNKNIVFLGDDFNKTDSRVLALGSNIIDEFNDSIDLAIVSNKLLSRPPYSEDYKQVMENNSRGLVQVLLFDDFVELLNYEGSNKILNIGYSYEVDEFNKKDGDYIVIDVNTTGYNPLEDQIIELAMIKYSHDGVEVDRFQSIFNPRAKVPDNIQRITQIRASMLNESPYWEDKLEFVKEFIGNLDVVVHNERFVLGFLRNNDVVIEGDVYDTRKLSRFIIKGLPNYKLTSLSRSFKLNDLNTTRALSSCITIQSLFSMLLDYKKIRYISSRYEGEWNRKDPVKGLFLCN